jgi:tetratricopeptide (TPR) repeat protein
MPQKPLHCGFAALFALSIAACEGSPPSPAATTASAPIAPASASGVAPSAQTAYEAHLEKLDERIAGLDKRAGERADDWLHLDELARALLERAKLTGDFADYARAEEALAKAMDRAPKGGGPLLTRASLNYTLHRLDRVEPDLAAVEGFAVVSPDERQAVKSLRADVAFHSGRYDEAKRAYEEILAEHRSPAACAAMAQYLWKTGELDAAAKLLEEAEQAASRSAPMTRAWVALVRGLLELDRENLDAALVHYRRAEKALPGYWLIEEHIAEIFAEKGQHDAALAIYDDVIARTQNPELMDAAADLHADKGDEAKAAEWRKKARAGHDARLKQFPEAASGHALDHYLQHDPKRALELAEQNHRTRPNGDAATKLAQAYLAVGRIPDARRLVEETLATPWRTAELHATAALVFTATGDAAAAETQQKKAGALAPGAVGGLAWLKPAPKP